MHYQTAVPGERSMIPILVSWSGGKDAARALDELQRSRGFEPVALITTLTQGYDRIAMHGIRRELLAAQAAAAGLPVIEAWQPQSPDNDAYEASFARALGEAHTRFPGLRHIAFGDLFLDDVREWREALCERHGWLPEFPLFGRDTGELAEEVIAAGLRARLCCVDTHQLDAGFAGREYDRDLLDDLPAGVDPCGENGEFHTCVYAGPMFTAPIPIVVGDTVLRDGRFAFTELTRG